MTDYFVADFHDDGLKRLLCVDHSCGIQVLVGLVVLGVRIVDQIPLDAHGQRRGAYNGLGFEGLLPPVVTAARFGSSAATRGALASRVGNTVNGRAKIPGQTLSIVSHH